MYYAPLATKTTIYNNNNKPRVQNVTKQSATSADGGAAAAATPAQYGGHEQSLHSDIDQLQHELPGSSSQRKQQPRDAPIVRQAGGPRCPSAPASIAHHTATGSAGCAPLRVASRVRPGRTTAVPYGHVSSTAATDVASVRNVAAHFTAATAAAAATFELTVSLRRHVQHVRIVDE